MPKYVGKNARFKGELNPGHFLARFAEKEDAFTSSEWKTILKVLQEGAAWERKHPEIDYFMPKDCAFMQRVRKTFPKVEVKSTVLGVSASELYKALKAKKV